MTARYNAYFNGNESFKEGKAKLEQNYKDDYTKILTVFRFGDEQISKTIYPEMDRAILKASKVIQRHEIVPKSSKKKKKKKRKKRKRYKKKKKKKGAKDKEDIHKNWIDDSYLLIGKSHFYKYDFPEAMESFEYVAIHYKKYRIKYYALIWMMRIYNRTGEFGSTQSIRDRIYDKKNINDLEKQPKKLLAELAATEADYFIQQKMYGHAIEPLEKAIDLTKKRKIRVRYVYILAQLYQKKREFIKASQYYVQVLKMNPSYEMAFNAQINRAKGLSGKGSQDIRKELEKMLSDEKNSEYFDQIYYALAGLAQRDGEKKAVIEYLKLCIAYSVNNDVQKGMAYERLANIYFDKPNYPVAKAYYDSASTTLPDSYENYRDVVNKKNSLKDIVKYLNIITYEDSLQQLAGMTEKERKKVIDDIIQKVIDDELKERELENKPRFDPTPKDDMPRTGSMWYFYNSAAMSFGYKEFVRKWGDRKLADNWRRKNKNSIDPNMMDEDLAENEEDEDLLYEIKGDPKQRESYLKNIPTNRTEMKASNERMMDAYYSLGIVYKELLLDDDQAIKTFERLLERFPTTEYRLSTCYQLYRLHLGQSRIAKANKYRDIILNEYADSDYAKIIQNPEYIKTLQAEKNKIERYYDQTYRAYEHNQYELVISRCAVSDSLFPKNKFQAKFDYLEALSIGKSQNILEFEKALKQVVEKHPNDEVKPRAEATLALIAKIKMTLKDTGIVVVSDTSRSEIYSYNSKMAHYYIIVIPDSAITLNKLTTGFSNYNTKFFSLSNLKTKSMLLDDDTHLIIIQKFSNSSKAIKYYDSIKENRKEIDALPPGDFPQFIISSANFPLFYKEKKIENYSAFFQDNYLSN